jgi:hypothetical protein
MWRLHRCGKVEGNLAIALDEASSTLWKARTREPTRFRNPSIVPALRRTACPTNAPLNSAGSRMSARPKKNPWKKTLTKKSPANEIGFVL